MSHASFKIKDSSGNWKEVYINGKTPTIGENGNWYVDGIDTGKPSKGKDGVSLTDVLVQETGNNDQKIMSQKAVSDELIKKQNTLVSGTNITRINGEDIINTPVQDIQLATKEEFTSVNNKIKVIGNNYIITEKQPYTLSEAIQKVSSDMSFTDSDIVSGMTISFVLNGANVELRESSARTFQLTKYYATGSLEAYNDINNWEQIALITNILGESENLVISQKKVTEELNKKQNSLVSGENIATINGQEIINQLSQDLQLLPKDNVVQEGGQSTELVMSQKAVSDALKNLELPIATDSVLGGVKAKVKTEDMTEEVGVDELGKLFTKPITNGNTYVIELDRWGITSGYMNKETLGEDGLMHYSREQYDQMYNNGKGFTDAIKWASDNGYNGVVVPKNDYCFCCRAWINNFSSPNILVQDIKNFDINLGGSKLSYLVDSTQRNKYTTETVNPVPYNQPAYLFLFAYCYNVSIHNGELEGDRLIRSYKEKLENHQEHTYGLNFGTACFNNRVYDIYGHDWMGDAVSSNAKGAFMISYDGRNDNPFSVGITKCHYIDKGYRYTNRLSTELVKDVSSCSISDFITFPNKYGTPYYGNGQIKMRKELEKKKIYTITNFGRTPNFYYTNIGVLTYNNVSDEPLRLLECSYMDNIVLLPNETRIKFQFYHDKYLSDLWSTEKQYQRNNIIVKDATENKGYKLIVPKSTLGKWVESEWELVENYSYSIERKLFASEVYSNGLLIENCIIENCYRGGISGGSNNNTIRNCIFSKSYNTQDNPQIPNYYDPTNYHIDYEDVFCKNLKVYNCEFNTDNWKGGKLLFFIYSMYFYNNNVHNSDINIYNGYSYFIHDNIISGSLSIQGHNDVIPNSDYTIKRTIKFHHNNCFNVDYLQIQKAYEYDDILLDSNNFKVQNIYMLSNTKSIAKSTNNTYEIVSEKSYTNSLPICIGGDRILGNSIVNHSFIINNNSIATHYSDFNDCSVVTAYEDDTTINKIRITNGILRIKPQNTENAATNHYINDLVIDTIFKNDIFFTDVNNKKDRVVNIYINNVVFKRGNKDSIFNAINYNLGEGAKDAIKEINIIFKNCDFEKVTSKGIFWNLDDFGTKIHVSFIKCSFNNKLKSWFNAKKPFRATQGVTANRPSEFMTAEDDGYRYFDTDLGKYIYYHDAAPTKWLDEDGNPADALKKGSSSQRPDNVKNNYQYFDTTLGKYIYYSDTSSTKWIDSDGYSTDIVREGTFSKAQEMVGKGIGKGFRFYCTDKDLPEDPQKPGLYMTYDGFNWYDDNNRKVDEYYPDNYAVKYKFEKVVHDVVEKYEPTYTDIGVICYNKTTGLFLLEKNGEYYSGSSFRYKQIGLPPEEGKTYTDGTNTYIGVNHKLIKLTETPL